MATITKTEGVSLLSHQAITHPGSAKGTELDVSTKLAMTIVMYHAMVEATANTNPGTFYVMTNPFASGDEGWAPFAKFTANATTPDTEALTATEPSGETVLAVASTTGFAALDEVYVQDTGTLADSEWHRLQQLVTNTSLDLQDGLVTGKDSSDVIWNDANVFLCQLDLTAVARVRVDFFHEGTTGANVHVNAIGITGDSIG